MKVSHNYILFSGREITRKVLLVVALTDRYTGSQPSGDPDVFINTKYKPMNAIRNPSGYYVFTRLPEGEFVVNVESPHYFAEQKTLTLSDLGGLDTMNPVFDIILEPNPSYPFPANATLIRGMVRDTQGHPIPGAQVEITGRKNGTQTTRKGEFVLFFNKLSEEDILLEGSKKFVTINGEKTIHVKAVHNSASGTLEIKEVQEGKTTSLPAPIILK
ncbi:MAG: hypothetical protein GTO45_38160 [Candidatus Aminicenantes bacterium]|nr:hypothetical protein [Candidatus Aminicenantes bacterium]NIM84450.1 hypothetical protein [Candidatus Aminicenantes bacterium]NIN23970.1 hypothetical protein [Candidatus Aminicenantes bacterium]NIN47684.1 hypothetical protein [Candidatus Aminicenantes bacterium]NIN90614.1 hypothetical protein [Candidatus Aminicenantes bacterium]